MLKQNFKNCSQSWLTSAAKCAWPRGCGIALKGGENTPISNRKANLPGATQELVLQHTGAHAAYSHASSARSKAEGCRQPHGKPGKYLRAKITDTEAITVT